MFPNSKLYNTATITRHAEMLANRSHKQWKKLRSTFERQNIGAYRVYDRDIPEVRAVLDWYEGHLVLGEYVREQTEGLPYLEALGDALTKIFGLEADHLHLRRRSTRPQEGVRYQRLATKGERIEVREGELKFLVNLDDYLDTGLFADHRITRTWFKKASAGKLVLNLYAYTGTFTAYAAAGLAASTTTVDLSQRYLDWAADNLALNQLSNPDRHKFIAAETRAFLRDAAREGKRWDLIMLDPPSFSTSRTGAELLEIQRDHAELLNETLAVLNKGGQLYFSTNHQRFKPAFASVRTDSIVELTEQSIPTDYQGREPHRLFLLEHSR